MTGRFRPGTPFRRSTLRVSECLCGGTGAEPFVYVVAELLGDNVNACRGLGLLSVGECLLRGSGGRGLLFTQPAYLAAWSGVRGPRAACDLRYSGKASCAATGNLGLVRRILGW